MNQFTDARSRPGAKENGKDDRRLIGGGGHTEPKTQAENKGQHSQQQGQQSQVNSGGPAGP